MENERHVKPYTVNEVIDLLKEKLSKKNMEFIGFDGEYKSTRITKANVKCNVCGHIDKLPVDSIINRKFGCKKCNKRANLFSENDFKEKCKLMGYEFIGFLNDEFKNGKSKLIYKCGKCGKTVIVNCRNFMKDCYRGCCNKPHHLSEEEYLNKLKNICKENNYELLSINKKKKISVGTRITYKCEKCGNITETSIGHLVNEGTRCPGCNGGSKLNYELIKKRINKRCDELNCTFVKFLNDENKYKNNLTRALLRCNTCGCEWDTTYTHFIRDTGCPKCGGSQVLCNEEALERALKKGKESNITVLGFVDDEYKNNKSRLELVCNECGYKWDMTYQNFMSGKGCPSCAGILQPTTEEWIERAKQIHGEKYDYSKSVYVNLKTPICIICPEHGEFFQLPYVHISGSGCPKCVGKNKTTQDFIVDAIKVHGNRYDYSKTDYKKSRENVCIICPEHGEFWQLPQNHLKGQGCPFCSGSNMEKNIKSFLDDNNILYEKEKTFKWLKFKSSMRLDFYLQDYNVAIECQGGQHFFPVTIFEGEEGFKKTIIRDKKKRELCEKHGIKIFYYSNCGIEYPYKVYEDLNEMLKDIKDYSYFDTVKKLITETTYV